MVLLVRCYSMCGTELGLPLGCIHSELAHRWGRDTRILIALMLLMIAEIATMIVAINQFVPVPYDPRPRSVPSLTSAQNRSERRTLYRHRSARLIGPRYSLLGLPYGAGIMLTPGRQHINMRPDIRLGDHCTHLLYVPLRDSAAFL
jgi:hypothetical protein